MPCALRHSPHARSSVGPFASAPASTRIGVAHIGPPACRRSLRRHRASGLLRARRSAASWTTAVHRQESINARSGAHTPRSTLASATDQVGAALEPLYELHKRFILDCRVLHADETPVALLDLAQARHAGPACELTREVGTTLRPASSTSSARAAGRSTPWHSWGRQQPWRATLVRHLAGRPLRRV